MWPRGDCGHRDHSGDKLPLRDDLVKTVLVNNRGGDEAVGAESFTKSQTRLLARWFGSVWSPVTTTLVFLVGVQCSANVPYTFSFNESQTTGLFPASVAKIKTSKNMLQ